MYILSMTNVVYFFVSVFFAIMLGVAYYLRKSSDDIFTLSASNGYGGGLLEFIAYSVLVAKFGIAGLSAIVYANVLVLIIQIIFMPKLAICYDLYIKKSFSKIIIILNVIILLVLIIASIFIFTKIILPVVGFNLINGSIVVTFLTLISALIGGIKSIRLNILWMVSLSFFIILLSIVIAYNMHNFNYFIHNLTYLGNFFHSDVNFYTTSCRSITINIMFMVASVLFLIRSFGYVSQFYDKSMRLSRLRILKFGIFQLIFSLLFSFIGILSISTIGNLSNNGSVITIRSKLPDGQIAYIVKGSEFATNSKGGDALSSGVGMGLVPPILDNISNPLANNKYDYLLSGVSMIQNYLPNNGKFLLLLFILSVFTTSMLEYSFYLIKCCALCINVTSHIKFRYMWRILFVTFFIFCMISVIIINYYLI